MLMARARYAANESIGFVYPPAQVRAQGTGVCSLLATCAIAWGE